MFSSNTCGWTSVSFIVLEFTSLIPSEDFKKRPKKKKKRGNQKFIFWLFLPLIIKLVCILHSTGGGFMALVMRYPIAKSNRSEVCNERSNNIFSSHLVTLHYKFQQFQTLLLFSSQLQAIYLNLISLFFPWEYLVAQLTENVI